MTIPQTIAIDGPAASGKSTLGQIIAHHFGYLYFDTGILYRALTYIALQRATDLNDGAALAELADSLDFDICTPTVDDGRQYTVRVNGTDITWGLRSPEVEQHVSRISCYPEVRSMLREQQRQIGRAGRVVMAGRDIGAVIMPDADLKLYLDASLEERARRRTEELHQRGRAVVYEDVLAELARRDQADAQNTYVAADAIALRTEDRSPQELLHAILQLMNV